MLWSPFALGATRDIRNASVLRPPLDPNPALFQPKYTRLVYNRVPKTGSSTMKALFYRLAKRNGFQIRNDEDHEPTLSDLQAIITSLPARTLYVNHCQF